MHSQKGQLTDKEEKQGDGVLSTCEMQISFHTAGLGIADVCPVEIGLVTAKLTT
jgi:hypothetical protein